MKRIYRSCKWSDEENAMWWVHNAEVLHCSCVMLLIVMCTYFCLQADHESLDLSSMRLHHPISYQPSRAHALNTSALPRKNIFLLSAMTKCSCVAAGVSCSLQALLGWCANAMTWTCSRCKSCHSLWPGMHRKLRWGCNAVCQCAKMLTDCIAASPELQCLCRMFAVGSLIIL